MAKGNSPAERTIALFILGALALNPPILAIFAIEAMLFGVPVLYLYLFAAWALLIGLLAWTTRTDRDAAASHGRSPPEA
jgi:hypothetical protein